MIFISFFCICLVFLQAIVSKYTFTKGIKLYMLFCTLIFCYLVINLEIFSYMYREGALFILNSCIEFYSVKASQVINQSQRRMLEFLPTFCFYDAVMRNKKNE